MNIRLIKENEYTEIEKILRSLPEWFGIEEAIVSYLQEIRTMSNYVAEINNQIIGFISINIHNKYSAEIHLTAIYKNYHNKKIGSKLLDYCENILKNKEIEFLQVKTLSETHPDKNYEKTRSFYFSKGFRPLEEIKKLWGEHNPCLIMIKKI